MNRVDNVNAFVLHQRQYRETSSIIDFYTEGGPLRAVCKGVHGSSKNAIRLRATLQPFAELSLSWFGRGELKTVRHVESMGTPAALRHNVLFAAMYLNELLLRLAPGNEQDGQSPLYKLYKSTLSSMLQLQQGATANDAPIHIGLEACLRTFELQLLEDTGFAVDFNYVWHDGQPIVADRQYFFDPQHGFAEHSAATLDNARGQRPALAGVGTDVRAVLYPGWVIARIGERDFSDAEVRRYAKQLARHALAPQLGERPLKTRELFR
ncbi:MAG: DNA repair protein RecO [Pseudomonadales bacterium]|nr:DNA repair protein RecO [Gammaproteobacteria bacterium]NNL56449.1 DNA repair protein RecO [Pseudomonadales bacterium]